MVKKLLLLILILSVALVVLYISIGYYKPADHCDSIHAVKDTISGNIDKYVFRDLKERRLLAVGESSHGTREFYDLRISLIESFLSEDIPLNILLELTIPKAQLLQKYITSDSADLQILSRIYPTLRNSSFKLFLEKCREANLKSANRDKIKIYGIDADYDESLISHLNQIIDESESQIQLPDELRGYFKNLKFESLIDVSDYQRNYIKSRLNDLKNRMPASASIEYLLAIEEFLQTLKRLEVPIISIRSDAVRDSSMARNVELIVSRDTLRQNILFAHNEHIVVNPSKTIVRMGSFLSNTFGENYYPIAVDFIEGEYTVRKGSDSTTNYYSTNEDKWLRELAMNRIGPLYAKTDNKCFDRQVQMHAIGAGYNAAVFKDHNLMNEFKAIILFRNGTPSEQIE